MECWDNGIMSLGKRNIGLAEDFLLARIYN